SAPAIQEIQVATAPPAALGGTVVDGTYYLSESIIYTGPGGASGPSGNSIRDTVVIANTASGVATAEEVTSYNGGLESRGLLTFTQARTMLTASLICPISNAQSLPAYTAAGRNVKTLGR